MTSQRQASQTPAIQLGELAAGIPEGNWRLDPSRSTLRFSTKSIWGLATVVGHFASFRGGVELRGGRASAWLEIDAASLATGHAKRDQHLRSGDFFDVERTPLVSFRPASVTPAGPARLRIEGTLSARGIDLPVQVDATARRVADGEYELAGRSSVDHRGYGMTWSPMGMVRGDTGIEVALRFLLEAGA